MYTKLIRPFLQKLNHENAKDTTVDMLHSLESNPLTLKALEYLANSGPRFSHPLLKTTVAGITFDNPLLVAAGWDKEGRCVKALHAIGFGGVEVGTVTTYPQLGNGERPRLFVIGDGVALNHFGFNSSGMEAVAKNLERYTNANIPIGINIGKNKYIPLDAAAHMYSLLIRRLYPYASYFTLGISSPNTANIKQLQQKKFLRTLVVKAYEMMEMVGERKPLFIKIAPEIDEKTLDGVIDIAISEGAAGIIAVNTYAHEHLIAKYGQEWEERPGGLSGNDTKYRNLATEQIARIYTKTEGKLPIIGVGGIHDTQSALEKIYAGASLLQIFTGIFQEGPSVAKKINQGLVNYMQKHHVLNITEMRGKHAQDALTKKDKPSFFITTQASNLPFLKQEYVKTLFQKNQLDTLLISQKPFVLKHGELGRKYSHIYLNHRTSLFAHSDYQQLFARALLALIQEKVPDKNFGLVSIASSSSPELTRYMQQESKVRLDRIVLLPQQLLMQEKGQKRDFYGFFDESKSWILVDDVFTSGKTLKTTIALLRKIKQSPRLSSVSLVSRNADTLHSFESATTVPMNPFISLDEILTYHWRNFSPLQKRLIQKERITLR